MSHIDGKMIYNLKRPVKMPVKGENKEVEYIELSEFTGKHFEYADKLECAITKAFFDMKERTSTIRDQEETGEEVRRFVDRTEEEHKLETQDLIEMLNMALKLSSVDRSSFVHNFKKMVTHKGSPLALVVGESPLTSEMFEDMHPKDMVGMAVEYCANFSIGLDFLGESGSNTSTTQSTVLKAL